MFAMAAANRVSDWRPLPPTPTNRALPPGDFKIREIRDKCSSRYLSKQQKQETVNQTRENSYEENFKSKQLAEICAKPEEKHSVN